MKMKTSSAVRRAKCKISQLCVNISGLDFRIKGERTTEQMSRGINNLEVILPLIKIMMSLLFCQLGEIQK